MVCRFDNNKSNSTSHIALDIDDIDKYVSFFFFFVPF